MKAFNIHVPSENNLTLTILFADKQFKIIYEGGIIGALKIKASGYEFISAEEVVPGQLPLYDYKQTNENLNGDPFILNDQNLNEIAEQIRLTAKSLTINCS